MAEENKRPFLIRISPEFLRPSLAARLFRKHSILYYSALYKRARLHLNPKVVMDLLPGDVISDHIALTGMYEHQKAKKLWKKAQKGGTFVDVGANLGFFSLLWASANSSNLVHSFEASPRNVELLKNNITINSFESQIVLHPTAVGKVNGKMEFSLGSSDQTGWGMFVTTPQSNSIKVEVVCLDDCFDQNKIIDVLKIDIEGADAWALQGFQKHLEKKLVREIWFEQNKPNSKSLGVPVDLAQEFLASLGYKVVPESDPAKDIVDWRAVPR